MFMKYQERKENELQNKPLTTSFITENKDIIMKIFVFLMLVFGYPEINTISSIFLSIGFGFSTKHLRLFTIITNFYK